MQPHQQRVVEEKGELDIKRAALERFLGGQVFTTLDPNEQARLRLQLSAMNTYSEVLTLRIAAF